MSIPYLIQHILLLFLPPKLHFCLHLLSILSQLSQLPDLFKSLLVHLLRNEDLANLKWRKEKF